MTKTKEMNGRLVAIGDVHGHEAALRSILQLIEPTCQDVIVTLGDYVNRGPHSSGVIECLLDLRELCGLIPVLGNHDEMLLDARKDQYAYDRFLESGGDKTMLSYGSQNLNAIPDSHWEFLESCQDIHVTEGFAFTHANFCRYTPLDQQQSSILRWTGVDEMEVCDHESGKTVVVGHSVGDSVRDYGTCVCIDTGCGFGGLLTAYEPATKKRWQVTEAGVASDSRHLRL